MKSLTINFVLTALISVGLYISDSQSTATISGENNIFWAVVPLVLIGLAILFFIRVGRAYSTARIILISLAASVSNLFLIYMYADIKFHFGGDGLVLLGIFAYVLSQAVIGLVLVSLIPAIFRKSNVLK